MGLGSSRDRCRDLYLGVDVMGCCPKVKAHKKMIKDEAVLGSIINVVRIGSLEKPGGILFVGQKQWAALVDHVGDRRAIEEFCDPFPVIVVDLESYCRVME